MGASAAERFVRGEMPVLEFWRRVEKGWQGRAAVEAREVARLIASHLEGKVIFAQLSAWAGTVAALSCFEVRGARVRAALSRLASSEPGEAELRALAWALTRSRPASRRPPFARRARRASGA